MLQPVQLKEVLKNYRNEIIELQDFLLKARFVFGTEESLPALIERLQQDRGFRRDLTSHLWVVIHTSPRTVSYADLLGMLAIAAAGTHFAEQAREEDAHVLLHFVMEARQALDQVSGLHRIPVMESSASVAASVPRAPVTPIAQPTPQPVVLPEPEPVRAWVDDVAEEQPQINTANRQYSIPLAASPEPAPEAVPEPAPAPMPPVALPLILQEPEPQPLHPLAANEVEAQPAFESARRQFRVPTVDPSRSPGPGYASEPESEAPGYVSEPAMFRSNPFVDRSISPEDEKPHRSRKLLIWIAAGVLVAVAGGAAGWHYYELAEEARPRPASIIRTQPAALDAPGANINSAPANPSSSATPAPAPIVETPAQVPVPAPAPTADTTATTADAKRAARDAKKPQAKTPAPPAHPPVVAHPNTAKPDPSTPIAKAPATPPPAASVAAQAPAPVVRSVPAPAAMVAKGPAPVVAKAPAPPVTKAPATANVKGPATATAIRPNSFATVSGTADFSHTTAEHYVPHLRRRTPEEQKALLAENQPAPAVPAKSSASVPVAAAPQVPQGSVSAITLGSNASYVIYNPTPNYPAAAASARVQGDVKIETDVSREGTIIAARVVSGPPALREAALEAAQRWRYRPNKVGGQAIPMSVVNVFQFQLP